MKFLIQVESNHKSLYENHSTYHNGDSGLDLFIIHDVTIQPGETKFVDLGVRCQCRSFEYKFWRWFTHGFYKYHSYMLWPRSSISKTPLIMRNSLGLIDSEYTGNIKAPLYNTSSEPFTLRKQQRYVQLVNPDLSPVYFKIVDKQRSTTRGVGGFGSTGA